jgi:hypothetical protein
MPRVSTSFSIRRIETPSRYEVATTEVSAASARRRRSSSQMLLWMSSGVGGGQIGQEGGVDVADDVALEAPHDVALG